MWKWKFNVKIFCFCWFGVQSVSVCSTTFQNPHQLIQLLSNWASSSREALSSQQKSKTKLKKQKNFSGFFETKNSQSQISDRRKGRKWSNPPMSLLFVTKWISWHLSCSRHRTTKFPNSESPIFTTKFLFWFF